MPKGRVITRSVTTSRPLNMTLNLECSEEPLSESQLMMRIKLKENYDRVAATLDELSKDHSGKMVCQAGPVNGYQYTMPPTSGQNMVKGSSQTVLNVNQTKPQAIKLNVLNNSGATSGNIQLVVDPRMGVILGQVSQPQGTTTTTAPTTSASAPSTHTQVENPAPTPVRGRQKPSSSTHIVAPTTTTPQGVTNLRIKTVNKQQQQQSQQPPSLPQVATRPTEQTSIGGIAVGSEQQDESRKNLPDGREVSFNKINGGRTFPSLVVVARPNLRTKDTPLQIAQKERSELDMKVKSVLMFSATKFAEWLIQQGLVRSEQHCAQHSNSYHKAKLKLGMYSDQGTFPYSGGYVWISNCCPERYVSVFSGSIFQGAPYTPTVLLKLIYHWSCQTNVQNVVSWVKVSNVYVKNFYTHLRSVCTAALWEKCRKMGGENSTIQVGVISLGTTSQDGNLRQVKVEVLGVLDLGTLELRLRACDPVQDVEKSYKRRFNNILYPLKDWVHTDSKIVTDFTVDKSTLQEMGFNYVTQSAFSEQTPRNVMSNYHIMQYLRKIVPRMFQNTLSLLSRQMIQQFLDELVWREMYGSTSARAFDNIILHIAEQTMFDADDSLLDRLAKIAANPFQDWSYAKFNSTQPLTVPISSTVNPEPATICSEVSSIAPIIVTAPASTTASSSAPSSFTPSTTSSAVAATAQNIRSQQDIPSVKVGAKRGRKRILPTTSNTESSEPSKSAADGARSTFREKDREPDNMSLEQIQLQEFYYATMEGDKTLLLREHKSSVSLKCFLCPVIMRSNTQVMEHTIGHVPPQMPDQSDSPVCRYCCTIFSSEHQMLTHVSETHSNFGQSESHMVVCAICEQKFGNSSLLVDHLSSMHYPSEVPYRCDACGYRTSSHKDAVDHFYKVHEMGDSLQCPYCLKVMQFVTDGKANATGVHAYLLHMQRHVIRREQGRGNKCSRCCLWFNQKSALKSHQRELHDGVTGSKVIPYSGGESSIIIPRHRMQYRRFDVDSPTLEIPNDERIRKWTNGPIIINGTCDNLACQECEEDIDEQDHYPAEQRCRQCRYITCCWRAFKEHQQQIHNERPMTSLTVPSPLINIPLEKKMQCPCGYGTTDGNRLASHLVKCKKASAYPVEDTAPTGMLNSLGLVPKSSAEEVSLDGKKAGPR